MSSRRSRPGPSKSRRSWFRRSRSRRFRFRRFGIRQWVVGDVSTRRLRTWPLSGRRRKLQKEIDQRPQPLLDRSPGGTRPTLPRTRAAASAVGHGGDHCASRRADSRRNGRPRPVLAQQRSVLQRQQGCRQRAGRSAGQDRGPGRDLGCGPGQPSRGGVLRSGDVRCARPAWLPGEQLADDRARRLARLPKSEHRRGDAGGRATVRPAAGHEAGSGGSGQIRPGERADQHQGRSHRTGRRRT